MQSPRYTNRSLPRFRAAGHNLCMTTKEPKSAAAVFAGKRIKTSRINKGMTQEQLCEATAKKLSASRIANYEQGIREVGIDEAKILAEALEVPACYLMGLVDEMDRQLLEYDAAIKAKIIETMKVAYRPLEERLAESVKRVTHTPRPPTVRRRMRR